MAAGVKTGGGEGQPSPASQQADQVSVEDDDFCPECFGDDLVDLPNGNVFCRECRAVIDY